MKVFGLNKFDAIKNNISVYFILLLIYLFILKPL